MSQQVHKSQNNSSHRFAIRCGGSIWPCVTWSFSCKVMLATHWPYWRYNLDVLRNFTSLLECPILPINVSVNFLDNSLHEFLHIILSNCLLKIQYVTHHFCMERNGVLHLLLKFKVCVVEEDFIGLTSSRLMCQMVHTLGNWLGHSSWQLANPPTFTSTGCDSRLNACDSIIFMRSPELERWLRILRDLGISIWDAFVVLP